MRRWFVIFMLFLLPIRGLVGDAMAYSKLPAGMPASAEVVQHATNTVAAYAGSIKANNSFEHENMTSNTAKPPCHMDVVAANEADLQQSQCTTCQACHLSAATPMQLPEGILHTTAAAPTQRTALWTSAEPRLLAKTPVL